MVVDPKLHMKSIKYDSFWAHSKKSFKIQEFPRVSSSFSKWFQVMWCVTQNKIKMFFQNDQNLVILKWRKILKNTKSWITRFWLFWRNILFCARHHITCNHFEKLDENFSTNQNVLKIKTKNLSWNDVDHWTMSLCITS